MEKSHVITENGIAEKTDAIDEIIREVSTKEELSELMERMPYIQTIQAPNGKVRRERYEDFEPGYMEKEKQFLYGEIAVCFEIPFEEVEQFENDTIKKHLEEF